MQSQQTHLESNFVQIIPQYIRPVTALSLLQQAHLKISKTKKICTLGPKTSTVQNLIKLMNNGMNIARLNFSHGTHESHGTFIDIIKQANKLNPNRYLAVLLDTKGPQIRTGKNLCGQQIKLVKGQLLQISNFQTLYFTATDYSHLSTSERISCSYSDIIQSVKQGNQVLFSDGKVSSIVRKIDKQNKIVTVEILNDGVLGQKKNMCLPGCIVNLPTVNDYDEKDIIGFGLKHKVDYIAVSFARYGKDIEYIRNILRQKDQQYSKRVRIISKIQNHQALQNLDQIIAASDGIMVARGDLGMETPLQKIILLQKLITTKCIKAGKTVIVATQMLQSMQSKPRPTRAQVSDITNAILDLADCTMTSGETANGQFPYETTSYMNKISIQTESVCDYKRIFSQRICQVLKKQYLNETKSQGLKLIEHSFQNNVDIICLKTSDLNLISQISSYRPSTYIFIYTSNLQQMKKLTALNYGVYVFNLEWFFKPEEHFKQGGISQLFGFKSQSRIKILLTQLNGKLFSCHLREVQV